MDKNCKKNQNVKNEKEDQNPQKMALFQKKGLNFAISKFSKFFKKCFFYKIKAQLEARLGKKIQKK